MMGIYKTRISSDYFTVQGLETRTGLSCKLWQAALVKELMDNALDAVEAVAPKEITVEYSGQTLKIFDNGGGLSIDDVKAVYDFENYASRNRHIKNISRGKQGNGLKCVVGVCYMNEYRLLWHTNDNSILCPVLNADNAQDGEIDIAFDELSNNTDCRGVEIQDIEIRYSLLYTLIMKFAECNRDVRFICKGFDDNTYKPIAEPINRQAETSLLFYDFADYKRLLSVQPPDMIYKTFLGSLFGTRIKNASMVKGKISDLNMVEVEADFFTLQALQSKKPLTLLKKHLIGYKNIFEQYPYIIEYEARKNDAGAVVMINNSIAYFDAASVSIPNEAYQVTPNRTIQASDLTGIFEAYKDFCFYVHIITPRPIFRDFGKTDIDISDVAVAFIDSIRRSMNREKKAVRRENKPKSKKDSAFENMDEAFYMASSGGKYSITARQMYYKLRELIGNEEWETASTYPTFTQDWLTQWLDDNPERESKVHFSDRGTFIIDGRGNGLGSANVETFLTSNRERQNLLTIDADIGLTALGDFDINCRYDKVLYIEKTGFNEVFLAEGIQKKYNILIVSGQGYGSRSARRLLYELQQKGLKIFCMHDLDVYGVNIYRSLGAANDKFKFDIDITDLGVTPTDVVRYNIKPEKIKAIDSNVISDFPYEHRKFFQNVSGYSQRVELNAFTTEQLLQILDDKLKGMCGLPKLDLSETLRANEQKLKEYALFQLVRRKYEKMLSSISIGDLPGGSMTYYEIMEQMPDIEHNILSKLTADIEKNF